MRIEVFGDLGVQADCLRQREGVADRAVKPCDLRVAQSASAFEDGAEDGVRVAGIAAKRDKDFIHRGELLANVDQVTTEDVVRSLAARNSLTLGHVSLHGP